MQKFLRRISQGSLDCFSAYLFQQSILNQIKIFHYLPYFKSSALFLPSLHRALYHMYRIYIKIILLNEHYAVKVPKVWRI